LLTGPVDVVVPSGYVYIRRELAVDIDTQQSQEKTERGEKRTKCTHGTSTTEEW
jgi:hypothetical protein